MAIGGGESLRLARKHYAQAMELHGGDDNLRALYGMCAVSLRKRGEWGEVGRGTCLDASFLLIEAR